MASFAVPVPDGDGGWFLVHDVAGGGPDYHVERRDAQGQTEVGTIADPMVEAIAAHYRLGSPALEGGSRGKGVVCAGATCRSGEIDLATLAQTAIGSATLAGVGNLEATGERWLACDAVEVLAMDPQLDDAGDGGRLHLLRILPNGSP